MKQLQSTNRSFQSAYDVTTDSSDSTVIGSLGSLHKPDLPFEPFLCEYLSPYVLKKQIQRYIEEYGIRTLLLPNTPTFRERSPSLFWNVCWHFTNVNLNPMFLLRDYSQYMQEKNAPKNHVREIYSMIKKSFNTNLNSDISLTLPLDEEVSTSDDDEFLDTTVGEDINFDELQHLTNPSLKISELKAIENSQFDIDSLDIALDHEFSDSTSDDDDEHDQFSQMYGDGLNVVKTKKKFTFNELDAEELFPDEL
jgi:hypothetical protein